MQAFFEVLFFLSLTPEEAEFSTCAVIYASAEQCQATSASDESWEFHNLETPIPFDVKSLAKLSHAADPWCTALLVGEGGGGELVIWGLLDQFTSIRQFQVFAAPGTLLPPGVLHARIVGVGNITVFDRDLRPLASLIKGDLPTFYDVLERGPVGRCLDRWLQNLRPAVDKAMARLARIEGTVRPITTEDLAAVFNVLAKMSLRRVLIAVRDYGHGGAILLSPDVSNQFLDVHFRMVYRRLVQALCRAAHYNCMQKWLNDVLSDGTLVPRSFAESHLRVERSANPALGEVTGCVRFIASLTRVDGLVLLDSNLVLRGFGCKINNIPDLPTLHLAGDEDGHTLGTDTAQRFGTRHQSMMRFCSQIPDSIGFVVSQDGDVRAMTRVGDNLVLWENVYLELTASTASPVPPIFSVPPGTPPLTSEMVRQALDDV